MKLHEIISIVTMFLVIGLTICVVSWGSTLSNNRKDIENYYEDTYKTIIRFSATWDRFMQVDGIEKKIIEMELDSIRAVMNRDFHKEAWRGQVDKTNIFTIKTEL